MFGSHLSIAGSMVNALNEAQDLGLDTVQVFTKNQQQWRVPPLDPGMQRDFVVRTRELGWEGRLVSHASYLINLASVSDDLWQKSVDLMTVEIERCAELGITYLVHHPGSHKDTTLEHGIARILDAYQVLFTRTRGVSVVSCLEGTAGGGSTIGGRFEDLAALRSGVARATGMPDRVGVCLDTCHLHAAGHDMSTFAAADATLRRFDEVVGLAHVRVWHINDSKGGLGSKIDRHDHIGHGWVGGGLMMPGTEEAGGEDSGPSLFAKGSDDSPGEGAKGTRKTPASKGTSKADSKKADSKKADSTQAGSKKAKSVKAATAKAPVGVAVGTRDGPATFDMARLRGSGFARVMSDARFAQIPKIMETPKEDLADATPWDRENLRRLKALMAE